MKNKHFIGLLTLLIFAEIHWSSCVKIDCEELEKSKSLSCDQLSALDTKECPNLNLKIVVESDKVIFQLTKPETDLLTCKKSDFEKVASAKFGPNQLKNPIETIKLFGSSLQHLNLTGNHIGTLTSKTFEKLSGLKGLWLQKTGLTNFNFNPFEALTQLETLDISRNKLTRLDAVKLHPTLSKLKTLYLGKNVIENANEVIQCLSPSLITLSLTNCSVHTVNASAFKEFKNLQRLAIDGTRLQNPQALLQSLNPNIVSINLSENRIGDITSKMFSGLTNLYHLYLRAIEMTSFSIEPFQQHKNLIVLHIPLNNLTTANFTLPDGVTLNLQKIGLNDNNLTELPGLTKKSYPALNRLMTEGNNFSAEYIGELKKEFGKQIMGEPEMQHEGTGHGETGHGHSSQLALSNTVGLLIITFFLASF